MRHFAEALRFARGTGVLQPSRNRTGSCSGRSQDGLRFASAIAPRSSRIFHSAAPPAGRLPLRDGGSSPIEVAPKTFHGKDSSPGMSLDQQPTWTRSAASPMSTAPTRPGGLAAGAQLLSGGVSAKGESRRIVLGLGALAVLSIVLLNFGIFST